MLQLRILVFWDVTMHHTPEDWNSETINKTQEKAEYKDDHDSRLTGIQKGMSKFVLRKTMSHLKAPCICGTQIPITVVASPNMCWISATDRRVSCDLRGTLGLWQRGGGVRHVSMSSSLSTL